MPLRRTEIVRIDRARSQSLAACEGIEIQCLIGDVWITQAGDVCNHFLRTAGRMVVTRNGALIIGTLGLEPAWVRVTGPSRLPRLQPFTTDSRKRFVERVRQRRNAAMRNFFIRLGRALLGKKQGAGIEAKIIASIDFRDDAAN